MGKDRIALVLGAGSARGLAHIGVLEVLEENKIPFDFIVGSSIGAMIGAIYACGTDIRMLGKMAEHLDPNIFLDISVPRMGFMAGRKVDDFLNLMTRNKTFADTQLPIYMVSTDLYSGKCVVLKEGLLAPAVRASISIPGVFVPVKKEDMLLVDGAVTDRLPLSVARDEGADFIIAVDVSFGEGKTVEIRHTLDVLLTALDIMQRQQFEAISSSADILLQPAVTGYSQKDFRCAGDIIQLGREAAEAHLPELLEKTASRRAGRS